jgi:2-polyprenyl-3-methyl-5-hydroxy-6-metoxy-1,4-benzoquinol methylase
VRVEWVVNRVVALRPRTLIDVGASDGSIAQRIKHESLAPVTVFAIEPHPGHREALAARPFFTYFSTAVPALCALMGVPGALSKTLYDAALIGEVLEHLDRDGGRQILAQLKVMVRELVITVPNARCETYLAEGRARRDWPDHKRMFDDDELAKTLAGWKDVKIEPIVGLNHDSIWLGATARS